MKISVKTVDSVYIEVEFNKTLIKKISNIDLKKYSLPLDEYMNKVILLSQVLISNIQNFTGNKLSKTRNFQYLVLTLNLLTF